MSIEKSQVATLVDELKSCLIGGTLRSLKMVEARTLLLEIENQRLLLCLQDPFLRFHLSFASCKTFDTPFSLKLQSQLKGCKLSSVSQLNEDRILQLTFEKYRIIVELFPKRPNLYLVDSQNQILIALNPVEAAFYNLPTKPSGTFKPGSTLSSRELERFYSSREQEAAFLHEKQAQQQRLQQRLKRLKKSETVCKEELEKGLSWREKQHEAELLQANFYRLRRGLEQIELLDWEKQDLPITLTLDSTCEPKEEVARRFKKAKKLHLSIEPLKRQIERIEKEAERFQQELKLLDAARTLEDLPTVAKPKEKEILRALPYREFVSASGLKIWVGKDAKSNDKLTFTHARGADWWLHVHDYPGAHVVLRVGKQQEPDPEALQDAIQVALAYSSAKDKGVAEVCVSQVKFLSRLKRGKAGQVQVSKHKLLQARFDAERFRQIKDRKESCIY